MIGEKRKNSREQVGKKKPELSADNVKVGCYVTLKCDKYREWAPQIGKITAIDNSTVTIDWLEGTYTNTWNYWKYRDKPVSEVFPRRAIIKPIELTASMRLKKADISLIKQDYIDTEYV